MRIENWQSAYYAAIDAALAKQFAWGQHDCISFCADIVDAITDLDVGRRMREKYRWSSVQEAYAIITQAGGLKALVEEYMGPAGPWVRCTLGDVVLATNRDGNEIVTIHDGHNLITADEVGIGSLPLAACIVGWKL